MATNTPKNYQNLTLYEIYVRNHGPNGTFDDVTADLDRIKELGVDVIWLMPIHPIGEANKKGKLGCPYSIRDYREVNPEYGTKKEFKNLIQRAHSLNLKVMIDVVFNHTAHDSVLALSHPEWFVHDENNKPASTVADWSDVVDFRFPNPLLEEYLIDTLTMWVKFGVDGFRCDVASLVPLKFWGQARKAIAKVKPEIIWLAESVDARWIPERRESGYKINSDAELYCAFDITYDYDIWPIWQAAVLGKVTTSRYLDMLKFQDCIYPENFIKLRCVENHDRKRIMALSKTRSQAIAWTAFQAFNKGTFLIYAGQESAAQNIPSLFDIDKIEWGEYELQNFIKTIILLKKDTAQVEGNFSLINSDSGIQATWIHEKGSLYGIFNTEESTGHISVSLKDGTYKDLLSGDEIIIKNGNTQMPDSAFIVRYSDPIEIKSFQSALFDIE